MSTKAKVTTSDEKKEGLDQEQAPSLNRIKVKTWSTQALPDGSKAKFGERISYFDVATWERFQRGQTNLLTRGKQVEILHDPRKK